MISIKENNSVTINCKVRNPAGTGVQDITGWTFQFQVRYANGDILFTKSSLTSGQMIVVNASMGLINVIINPSDTTGVSANDFVYEFKGTDGSGNEYTLDGPAQFIITPTII